MKPEPELEAYLREAVSWDTDRVERINRAARIAWLSALAGWFCAVASASALAMLLPLKSVEPFVVRVDNSTGIVDVVPVYAGSTGIDEAITRYFLTHYVTVCERFNPVTAESDYEECGAFHSTQRNAAWYALWNRNNPASPLNVHRDGSTVRAQVVSVSFLRRSSGIQDLAQVRYVKSERQGAGAVEKQTHWIATVQYGYASPPRDPRSRGWNPLGFRVLEMGSEPEAPPSSQTVAANSIAAGAVP